MRGDGDGTDDVINVFIATECAEGEGGNEEEESNK